MSCARSVFSVLEGKGSRMNMFFIFTRDVEINVEIFMDGLEVWDVVTNLGDKGQVRAAECRHSPFDRSFLFKLIMSF